MEIKIELDREEDGRWIADVIDLPGVVAYGATRNEAVSRAEAVAMRVIADRIEIEQPSEAVKIYFAVA
jgi:predicted RNase H-like HicB family nuclease